MVDLRKQYSSSPDLKTLFNSVAGDTSLAFFAQVNLKNKLLNHFYFTLIVCDVLPQEGDGSVIGKIEDNGIFN